MAETHGSADDGPDAAADQQRGLIGGIIGRVAPAVVRQIDTDDLNELIDRLDVNAIAERLDLDALLERMDVNAIAEQLDLDALLERMDVDAIAERLDLDALLERMDINAIAERLDLDALMGRLDMAQLTADATGEVATSGLDLVRRQLIRVDATVDGFFDRVLRRAPGDRPVAPGDLAIVDQPEEGPDAAHPHDLQRQQVSGHYAGPVTRLLALTGDIWLALTGAALIGAVSRFVVGIIVGEEIDVGWADWAGRILVALWLLAWFWLPIAYFGRTVGMGIVGLAVVTRQGGEPSRRQAFVRAVVLPFALMIFLIAFIGMVIGRERRTLYDVASGTVVVYDWGEREAEQPVSIRDQLSAHVRRPRAA